MLNEEIARIFESMARVLAFRGQFRHFSRFLLSSSLYTTGTERPDKVISARKPFLRHSVIVP